MSDDDEAEVFAAGGVVLRAHAENPEVAIVHRPRYDDWSLPKGKLDPGESFEEAALREVLEETGLRGRLGPELGSTTYRDRKGRLKLVRYWAMSAQGGEFVANEEVDELRWADLDEARAALSYGYDRDLVERAFAAESRS